VRALLICDRVLLVCHRALLIYVRALLIYHNALLIYYTSLLTCGSALLTSHRALLICVCVCAVCMSKSKHYSPAYLFLNFFEFVCAWRGGGEGHHAGTSEALGLAVSPSLSSSLFLSHSRAPACTCSRAV